MTSLAFLIKLQNPCLKRLTKMEVTLQEKEQFIQKILFLHKHKWDRGHKQHIYPEGKKNPKPLKTPEIINKI